jgi:hypothetical protein
VDEGEDGGNGYVGLHFGVLYSQDLKRQRGRGGRIAGFMGKKKKTTAEV